MLLYFLWFDNFLSLLTCLRHWGIAPPFSCVSVWTHTHTHKLVHAHTCGIQRVILGIILYSFSTSFFLFSVKPREIAAHKPAGSGELQVTYHAPWTLTWVSEPSCLCLWWLSHHPDSRDSFKDTPFFFFLDILSTYTKFISLMLSEAPFCSQHLLCDATWLKLIIINPKDSSKFLRTPSSSTHQLIITESSAGISYFLH